MFPSTASVFGSVAAVGPIATWALAWRSAGRLQRPGPWRPARLAAIAAAWLVGTSAGCQVVEERSEGTWVCTSRRAAEEQVRLFGFIHREHRRTAGRGARAAARFHRRLRRG